MSAIPFSARELTRAWRELSSTALPIEGKDRTNPHRLLLFYAVECGLKAVWLKRKSRDVFDSEDIEKTGHNLRQIIKDLKVGGSIELPRDLRLEPLTQGKNPRNGDISILHQAWRYGGKCVTPSDQDCELQLERVLNWIQGELK
jgi:hypothetical protein